MINIILESCFSLYNLRWQIKPAEQVFNAFALMTKFVVII